MKQIRQEFAPAMQTLANVLALGAVLALGLMVLVSFSPAHQYPGDQWWEWRPYAVTAIVMLPVFAMGILALSLWFRANRMHFELMVPPEVEKAFNTAAKNVLRNWEYERARYLSSLTRMFQNAMFFGALASGVVGAAIMATNVEGSLSEGYRKALQPAALAVVVATMGAFTLYFARFLVRISTQDFNARMFSWAFKSLTFVVLAAIACCAVTQDLTYPLAVGIGLLSAAFGEVLLSVMLAKISAALGVTLPNREKSRELLKVQGVKEEDLDRLEEEGIESLHALAFVPTSRLFFNSNHSLQRVVDWQNQALLLTYVGPIRAQGLVDALGIRGAIGLQGLARMVVMPGDTTNKAFDGINDYVTPKQAEVKLALGKALNLETPALDAALMNWANDEVITRLRIHWHSVPNLGGEGQEDDEDSLERAEGRRPDPGGNGAPNAIVLEPGKKNPLGQPEQRP